jgi:hypothetical protein
MEFKVSRNPRDRKMVAWMEHQEWWEICMRWGKEVRSKPQERETAALREHLVVTQMINGRDMLDVPLGSLKLGMTECGMYAVLGKPTRVNRSQYASGMHKQYIYENQGTYVYTLTAPGSAVGVITSWQD